MEEPLQAALAYAFSAYQQESALVRSAWRTGDPTRDVGGEFYGQPIDDFRAMLDALESEMEARAYLAIIAAAEAVLQTDFRARAEGRSAVSLRTEARKLTRRERKGPRIALEEILEAWKSLPDVRRVALSNFEQLLPRRHWYAHGRYFNANAPVPGDPGFAFARAQELIQELKRVDDQFPRRQWALR